jgi:hypothetical protein
VRLAGAKTRADPLPDAGWFLPSPTQGGEGTSDSDFPNGSSIHDSTRGASGVVL